MCRIGQRLLTKIRVCRKDHTHPYNHGATSGRRYYDVINVCLYLVHNMPYLEQISGALHMSDATGNRTCKNKIELKLLV